MEAGVRRRDEKAVSVVGRAGQREVEHELVAACGEDVDDVMAQRKVVDVMAEQLTVAGGMASSTSRREHSAMPRGHG